MDILTISRRLGHSKPSVTLDTYRHLIKGADAAAAEAIEGVLKKLQLELQPRQVAQLSRLTVHTPKIRD